MCTNLQMTTDNSFLKQINSAIAVRPLSLPQTQELIYWTSQRVEVSYSFENILKLNFTISLWMFTFKFTSCKAMTFTSVFWQYFKAMHFIFSFVYAWEGIKFASAFQQRKGSTLTWWLRNPCVSATEWFSCTCCCQFVQEAQFMWLVPRSVGPWCYPLWTASLPWQDMDSFTCDLGPSKLEKAWPVW